MSGAAGGTRNGAMSSQICFNTAGSIVAVSRLSGAFSEYISSVTLPQCGPIASGSSTCSPSWTASVSEIRRSITNGWTGVTSLVPQSTRIRATPGAKCLIGGNAMPCVSAAPRAILTHRLSTCFGVTRTSSTAGWSAT